MDLNMTGIKVKKRDILVDLDNGYIKIDKMNLTLDINLVKDAYERVRQLEGFKEAKEKNIIIGRPKKTPSDFIYYYNEVLSKSLTAKEAAEKLEIGRSTYYRLKKKYEAGSLTEEDFTLEDEI